MAGQAQQKDLKSSKRNLRLGHKKIMQKIFIFFCLFLSSCVAKKERPKDTLFVLLDSRPETLDPRKAVSANGMRIVDLLFNSLVSIDQKGNPSPDLAIKWELKGLTWIFTLKPDLKFSNGRPVLKQDILFSFKEFKQNSVFQQAFKNIQSVEVLQNTPAQFIVKVTLKEFQAPFLASDLPVLKILPKQESFLADFSKKPIGTGLFKVTENSFRRLLLQRVAFAPTNQPQKISFEIIRDGLTRTQQMLSQSIDIAPSVLPLEKLSRFKKQPEKFKIVSTAGFSTTYLLINLQHKLLKQKKLRQALSLAIHTQQIIKYKMYDYAVPALSFVNPNSFFFNQKLKSPAYDLAKAQEIIKELALVGAKLKLSASNQSDTVVKARVLASQISQSGLKVSLQVNEWGTFYKDVGQGAFDLALMKWVGARDPDIYRISFHSENQAPKGRNRSFYSNKTMDKLLEQALREKNLNKRKALYDQIQFLIAKDFVVIPLWHDKEISVLRSPVIHYQIRTNGDFLSLALVKKQKGF